MKTYDLAYHLEQRLKDGSRILLELHRVHVDNVLFVAKEIGDVLNGLALEIQGQSEDVDSPIVKTSLTMSFVDVPERNSLTQQWGSWEFLYTPDSEGWKVVLLVARNGEDRFRTLWSGYVTPDSYTETLSHHGVVTITARDNIGHLADMEFDGVGNGAGMITPYELINQAWAKISSPMTLDWRGLEDENEWLQTEGVDAINTYLNVAAFDGMTWYDAVSDVLYAYGLTMRYTGNNKVSICPLRRVPEQGVTYDMLRAYEPTFAAYATRELTPAVREIEETVTYKVEEGAAVPFVGSDDFDGTSQSCIVTSKDVFGSVTTRTVLAYPISNQSDQVDGWGNMPTNTIFFNPESYGVETDLLMYFIANTKDDKQSWYSRAMYLLPVRLHMEFGAILGVFNEKLTRAWGKVTGIKASIRMEYDGAVRWYTGNVWQADYKQVTLEPSDEGVVDYDINITADRMGRLTVFFEKVVFEPLVADVSQGGTYLGIKDISFQMAGEQKLTGKNTVKTVYDETNNVRLTRQPEFGPTTEVVALPGIIGNGIFRKDGEHYVPTPLWKWPGEAEGLQLAAQVHKQLLMFYSKPNNLLEGDILNADLTNVPVIWQWHGKEHFMQSGRYNFVTNRIEGAVLREFKRYEDLW